MAAGTNNAAFRFRKKVLTLRTTGVSAIKRPGFEACGLKKDAATDISRSGCSVFRSVEEAPVEYDLARRDADLLYFGERPADGNMGSDDKRPRRLGPPVRKVDGK